MDTTPDSEQVLSELESETGLHWEEVLAEEDYLRFVTEVWQFDVVYSEEDEWCLELFDVASPQYGSDEPRWTMSGLRNETEILEELPGFIPNKVRV